MIIDEHIGSPVTLPPLGSKGPMVRCADGVYRLQADCPPGLPPVGADRALGVDEWRAQRMSKLAESLENIPPAASMVVPGAITFLVDRKKHPIIWTIFGVVPLGFAVVRAISKGRLF